MLCPSSAFLSVHSFQILLMVSFIFPIPTPREVPLYPPRIFLVYFVFCMFIRTSVSFIVSNWGFPMTYFHLFLFIVNENHVFFTIFDIFSNLYSIISSIIIHYLYVILLIFPQTASASSLSSHQSLRYTALHP